MNDEFKNVEQQLLKTMLKFDMISNSKFYRTEDTVQVRVARLLILLNSIEEQLLLIKNNLKKVWNLGYKTNNETLKSGAASKLKTVEDLSLKIIKARLNLTYYF